MFPTRHLFWLAALPAAAGAANLSSILGPITPVYEGDATGTSFSKPGWFPDAQFPLVWGGANEPDTNLSWWMARHSGGFLLDYNRADGVWIPGGPEDSPDERGYWIQDVYRPVDVDPSLRGRMVTLQIYPPKGTYSSTATPEEHKIDDNYLVGFAHIEDWNGKEVNGSRTIYSIDNGKNWKKGPLRAMSICAIDTRTNPGQPRLVKLWQKYRGPGWYEGWKTTTTDLATGVDGYTQAANSFSHGNLYGFTGMTWSRYLNKWLVMYGFNGSHGKDLQFLTTSDFESYSTEPSVSIEKNEVPGRSIVAGPGDYPTLLGGFPQASAYPLPFNKEVGQLGWIYNKNNGLSGRAIHFIAPVEKRITWQGADASKSATLRIVPAAGRSAAIRFQGRTVADLDDEDGDGIPNLMEHATGCPLGERNAMPGTLSRETDGVHFLYTRDLSAGIRPVVEWSDTLLAGDWRTDGISEKVTSTRGSIEEVQATLPSSSGRRFIRLRVTRNGEALPPPPAALPVALGNGVTLTLDQTEISAAGGTATWTFTRSGSAAEALAVPFGITGTAAFPGSYEVAGTASFDGSAGTVVIPAGQASTSFTTTANGTAGDGGSIILSAPGALRLATAGNWNQSGTAINGIVDETHTLDFNSAAGGTFQNDIPITKRIRSINFGAGSGDHVINGNRIELEAVNKWLSTGYAVYSINQYAAKTATFNADINTRSAALYLRSWQVGGKIVLNGTTDMLGTGGVVISGAGDVAINGDLTDSGYKDFTSGQPELVAGANAGRLIMAGDGLLSLAGDNTFSGRTEIKYGSVRIESPQALQNSVVTVKKHDALVPVSDFKLGGLDGYGNINLGGRNLTLGNHNRPDCYTTNYTGVIRGNGSITKVDGNTQRLGTVNQHTGGIILKGGVLEIPGSSRTAFGSGAIEFDGGKLRATGAVVADNPVVVSSGGTLDTGGRTIILNGPLSGSGPLSVSGSGALVLNTPGTYTGTLFSSGEIRANVSGAFGSGGLHVGGRINLGADQTLGGLTITATAPVIDTGPFTLTVNGPIRVAADRSLVKAGAGMLDWTGSAAEFNGSLVVNGGIFRATGSGDVTQGDITLNGATLSLHSAATGAAAFDIARQPGRTLTVNGAARLILDKGTADTLVATIGSGANPGAFAIGESSTVVATLGPATLLRSAGQGETPTGAIYPPSFLLATADRSGDFAAYSSSAGFIPFTGYVPRSGAWSATEGEIANITGPATLAANATVNGLRVQGSAAVTLTSRVLSFGGMEGKAGIILNNGSLTGGAVDFGTNKGYIYASGPDASIASAIRGSGGIIFTGLPGTKVKLTSWETTYSTWLTVAGTTLELPNLTVMGESGTPITLDGGGTLLFPNALNLTRDLTFGSGGAGIEVAAGKTVVSSGAFSGSGPFRKSGAGYLKLNGAGTATGAVTIAEGTLEYISTAIQGSSGPITVETGARANISYTASGKPFTHDLRIAGNGPNGEGALSIGGSGGTASSITLTDDARIQAASGATFALTGPILGQGHSLDFSGSGRFGIHAAVDVEGGDLSLSQTPYLSIKSTSSVVCGNLTTAANSTFEMATRNTRIGSATIGGRLYGQKGRLTAAGMVMISPGGIIAGGLLDTPDLFTIDGDLTLMEGSTCHAYVKGAVGASSDGAGSQHGQILVTGAGVVAGTLKLVVDAAYTPATGDEIFVMLRNGGSGAFSKVVVVEDSATMPDQPGVQGSTITIKGKTGTLRYNSHSSINLSSPAGAYDVSIKF